MGTIFSLWQALLKIGSENAPLHLWRLPWNLNSLMNNDRNLNDRNLLFSGVAAEVGVLKMYGAGC